MRRLDSGAAVLILMILTVLASTNQLDAQTVVLDQSNEAWDAGSAPDEKYDMGQTFTVGVAGTLSRIEVFVGRGVYVEAPLRLEILTTTDGVPNNSPVLATAAVPASDVPTTNSWISFDISAAQVPVSVGEVLAIVLVADTPYPAHPGYRYNWYLATWPYNPYPGGKRLIRNATTGTWGWYDTQDCAFKTFVQTNQNPIANAGPDETVECTGALTTVSLNASASSDPDGDELGFEWSLPEGSGATIDDPASATPTGQFPLGPTLVTLTVTDGNGGVACDDVLITVVDSVAPVLVATTDKIALWPPNHEMRDVLVSVEITDCAWDTGTAITAWVSSSEPDDATGDGSYTGDVDGQDGFAVAVPVDLIYTGEPEPGVYLYEGIVSLRAERDGSQSSRVYSIVCDIEDFGGNTSTASCVVVVPHDRRNK